MRTYFFFVLSAIIFLPFLVHAQTPNDFVPLTTLPNLKEVAETNSLAPFLSQIYKICIGLAAVLAVLQLMRAGIMYMGGDSITEKKEARQLITLSIVGLILVLSPVIVFSVINPAILNLDIHTDNLKSGVGTASAPASSTPAQTNSATNPICSPFSSFSHVTSSELCSALGSDWKDAPASCCSLGSGQQCCGK